MNWLVWKGTTTLLDNSNNSQQKPTTTTTTTTTSSKVQFLKLGHLTKQGSHFKSWRNRHFLLKHMTEDDSCCLTYHKQQQQQDGAQGAIDMFHVYSIGILARTKEEFSLKLEGHDDDDGEFGSIADRVPEDCTNEGCSYDFAIIYQKPMSNKYYTLYLRAESEDQRCEWIKALMQAKSLAKQPCRESDIKYRNRKNETWELLTKLWPPWNTGATVQDQSDQDLSFGNIDSFSYFTFEATDMNDKQQRVILAIDRLQIQNVRNMTQAIYQRIESDTDSSSSDYVDEITKILRDYKRAIRMMKNIVQNYFSIDELQLFLSDSEERIQVLCSEMQTKLTQRKLQQFMGDFTYALEASEQILNSEPEYIVCSMEHALEQVNDEQNEFKDESEFIQFKRDYNLKVADLMLRARTVLYSNFLDRVLDRVTQDLDWAEESTTESEVNIKLNSAASVVRAIYEVRPELKSLDHPDSERVASLLKRVESLERKISGV